LRKEEYNQEDIDLFFKSVVLSKLTYALPVHGARNAELNVKQSFLNRCFRRHYTSKLFNIHELLKQFDKRLFHKIRVNACHPYIHFSLKSRTRPCVYDKEQVNCPKLILNASRTVL
jgi:hypothetical protein